ncbi:MAG TPA: YqhA family protein [Acetobacteraceae bacterium]
MNDAPTRLISDAALRRLERSLGRVVFATRWLMAPIYVGLLASLVLLALKFVQKLIQAIRDFLPLSTTEEMLVVLQLVDIALVANLVLIVMFAGWENVIGPLLTGTKPQLTGMGFGAVKLRLMGSIAAVAAIQILETFMHISEVSATDAMWQLAILLGIGITGVLLALMDWLAGHH